MERNMKCKNCETTSTPLWRRDLDGCYLCNACGLYLKIHNMNRPKELKTESFKQRQRKKNFEKYSFKRLENFYNGHRSSNYLFRKLKDCNTEREYNSKHLRNVFFQKNNVDFESRMNNADKKDLFPLPTKDMHNRNHSINFYDFQLITSRRNLEKKSYSLKHPQKNNIYPYFYDFPEDQTVYSSKIDYKNDFNTYKSYLNNIYDHKNDMISTKIKSPILYNQNMYECKNKNTQDEKFTNSSHDFTGTKNHSRLLHDEQIKGQLYSKVASNVSDKNYETILNSHSRSYEFKSNSYPIDYSTDVMPISSDIKEKFPMNIKNVRENNNSFNNEVYNINKVNDINENTIYRNNYSDLTNINKNSYTPESTKRSISESINYESDHDALNNNRITNKHLSHNNIRHTILEQNKEKTKLEKANRINDSSADHKFTQQDKINFLRARLYFEKDIRNNNNNQYFSSSFHDNMYTFKKFEDIKIKNDDDHKTNSKLYTNTFKKIYEKKDKIKFDPQIMKHDYANGKIYIESDIKAPDVKVFNSKYLSKNKMVFKDDKTSSYSQKATYKDKNTLYSFLANLNIKKRTESLKNILSPILLRKEIVKKVASLTFEGFTTFNKNKNEFFAFNESTSFMNRFNTNIFTKQDLNDNIDSRENTQSKLDESEKDAIEALLNLHKLS